MAVPEAGPRPKTDPQAGNKPSVTSSTAVESDKAATRHENVANLRLRRIRNSSTMRRRLPRTALVLVVAVDLGYGSRLGLRHDKVSSNAWLLWSAAWRAAAGELFVGGFDPNAPRIRVPGWGPRSAGDAAAVRWRCGHAAVIGCDVPAFDAGRLDRPGQHAIGACVKPVRKACRTEPIGMDANICCRERRPGQGGARQPSGAAPSAAVLDKFARRSADNGRRSPDSDHNYPQTLSNVRGAPLPVSCGG